MSDRERATAGTGAYSPSRCDLLTLGTCGQALLLPEVGVDCRRIIEADCACAVVRGYPRPLRPARPRRAVATPMLYQDSRSRLHAPSQRRPPVRGSARVRSQWPAPRYPPPANTAWRTQTRTDDGCPLAYTGGHTPAEALHGGRSVRDVAQDPESRTESRFASAGVMQFVARSTLET